MANQVIHKYPVSPIVGVFNHRLPKDAEVLCVQVQNGTPQIWVLLDPNAEKEIREFVVAGERNLTQELSECRYIGTYQQPPFVWHLFES